MKKLVLVLSLLALSSCASLSKEDCESINWKNQGYTAAAKGERPTECISRFKKQCTDEYNVKINNNEFVDGYKQGLQVYCSKSNLYQKGLSGDEYKGICDSTATPEVAASFTSGRVKFLENEVSDLEDQVRRLKSEVNDLQSKVNNCPIP